MRYRLLVACVGVSCITTFLSLQQTHQQTLEHKNLRRQNVIHPVTAKNKLDDISSEFLKEERFQTELNDALLEKYYKETFASERFIAAALKRNLSLVESDRFLLPVLYYNMGPNNLFRIFKESIVITYLMKRTLVIPPFHHHPRMKRTEEDKRSEHQKINVDIFDQSFESVMESDSTKSLDMKILNSLLPTATLEKFQMHCEGNLDMLVHCGDLRLKRKLGLRQFQKILNISIFHSYSANNFRDILNNKKKNIHFLSVSHKAKDSKCIGLALGSKCLGSRRIWFENWKYFSNFVRRPSEVKILAEQFITTIFSSQPYLAVHWRYDPEDWKDMCKSSRPNSVRDINQPMCEMATQLLTNTSLITSIATSLQSYAIKRNFKYIYFATPPQLLPFVNSLQSKVSNLFFISDVLKFSLSNMIMENVFDNNYSASFLEQEICYLAKEFLGSPLSSWTQTVMLDRFAEGRNNHGSILDIAVKGKAEFPKLEWYFPEGD